MGVGFPDVYQQRVIESTCKDCVVVAGAGSGKTTTLVSKVAHLVNNVGVDPASILVLTFTRTAAGNMRSKYDSICESLILQNSLAPEFCTFHSFCYGLLVESSLVRKAIGYSDVPRVIDDKELHEIRSQVESLLGFKKPSNSSSGAAKRKLDLYARTLEKVLRSNNVVDYDTMCKSVCSLFAKKDKSVLSYVNQYKHLLVDEFQDTDESQYQFVRAMSECSRTLFGDPLQNIYQFRGCSNEPLKQLLSNGSWVKYELPVDYRSSRQICEYVNAASLSFGSKEYSVNLVSTFEGAPVRAVNMFKMDVKDTCKSIKKYYEFYSRFGFNMAVLLRTNREVDQYSSSLTVEGVPCLSASEERARTDLLSAISSKDLLNSWYSELMDPSDYARYCNLLLESSEEVNVADCLKATSSRSKELVLCASYLRSALESDDAQTRSFVLCDYFEVDVPENASSMTPADLVSYVSVQLEENRKKCVTVGTVHSVKGLEFDAVVVAGVNGTTFKVDREETENLFYVACTRAAKSLAVFYSSSLPGSERS